MFIVRTKALLEEHAFKVNILSIRRLVAHADLFIFGTEASFDHVQREIAIRPESYATAFSAVRESILIIRSR